MLSRRLRWPPDKKIVFTEEAKRILRKPAGELITGDPDHVSERIKRIVEREKPSLVIAVGDYVSAKLRERNARVNLYVIDGKIERRRVELFKAEGMRVVKARNEAGTLNPDAVKRLHEILQERLEETVLRIEGEEDLMTLAAILSAPERSMIIYGQPGRGCVIVRVNEAIRKFAVEVLKLVGYPE